jgi:hypothetical protein
MVLGESERTKMRTKVTDGPKIEQPRKTPSSRSTERTSAKLTQSARKPTADESDRDTRALDKTAREVSDFLNDAFRKLRAKRDCDRLR